MSKICAFLACQNINFDGKLKKQALLRISTFFAEMFVVFFTDFEANLSSRFIDGIKKGILPSDLGRFYRKLILYSLTVIHSGPDNYVCLHHRKWL